VTPASSSPRVADFSGHLSGPLASHYLAELGADVVKVENKTGGDGNRGVVPFIHGVGMIHVNCGPGVRSLAADVRSPHWPDVVRACCQWADVVIVGSRPRDAARRSLDFASVSRHNPDVVYCAITGYGDVGPLRNRHAHGQQMDALAGNVPVEWTDGQPRTPRGFRTAGTTAASMFAVMGIWAALFRRDHDLAGDGPRARIVDVSCWRAAMAWQWRDMTTLANLGHAWTEYDEAGSRYAMYATSDGRALLLCPLERHSWEAFCDLAGLEHLRARGDWSDNGMEWGIGPFFDDERRQIERRVLGRTLDEWTSLLAPTGVPFAPVLTREEALQSEHARATDLLGHTTVGGRPARFSRAGVTVQRPDEDEAPLHLPPPPAIGEHTEQVLHEIGLGRLAGSFP